jgi:hypothetical protein
MEDWEEDVESLLRRVGAELRQREEITVETKYHMVARDKPGLLIAMMRALCGTAHISFEGDLSKCRLAEIAGATDQETSVLKRNTLWPRQDFMVVPLEADTIRPIMDRVLPQGRIVHDVDHVQIEKNGKLEFGAYDNFHPECIGAGAAVLETLLQELTSRGVLRSYELVKEAD